MLVLLSLSPVLRRERSQRSRFVHHALLQHKCASLQQLRPQCPRRRCGGDGCLCALSMKMQHDIAGRRLVEDASTSSREHRTTSQRGAGSGSGMPAAFSCTKVDRQHKRSAPACVVCGPTKVRGSRTTPVLPHAPQEGCLGWYRAAQDGSNPIGNKNGRRDRPSHRWTENSTTPHPVV